MAHMKWLVCPCCLLHVFTSLLSSFSVYRYIEIIYFYTLKISITIIHENEKQAKGMSVFPNYSTSPSRNSCDKTINDAIKMFANETGLDVNKHENDRSFKERDSMQHQRTPMQFKQINWRKINRNQIQRSGRTKCVHAESNFRWFEIGQSHPNKLPPDHKVIILMGATGSGKSTGS